MGNRTGIRSRISRSQDLLGRTIEAISLLLIDYRISGLVEQARGCYMRAHDRAQAHLVMYSSEYVQYRRRESIFVFCAPTAMCQQETQNMVSPLTYEGLIATDRGLSVSRALVNVIINSQIG